MVPSYLVAVISGITSFGLRSLWGSTVHCHFSAEEVCGANQGVLRLLESQLARYGPEHLWQAVS